MPSARPLSGHRTPRFGWARSRTAGRVISISRGTCYPPTPGKIEVTGPDAAEFLSRFYVSNMATLKPGRVRSSVMLKEDGVIYDDGVVACLAANHYLASPTSGQAEAVAA